MEKVDQQVSKKIVYFSYAYFGTVEPVFELPHLIIQHIKQKEVQISNEQVEYSSQEYLALVKSFGCTLPEDGIHSEPHFIVYERSASRLAQATHVVALANGPTQSVLMEIEETVLNTQFTDKPTQVLILARDKSIEHIKNAIRIRALGTRQLVIKTFSTSDDLYAALDAFLE